MGNRRRERSIALGVLALMIATVIAVGVDGSLASRSGAASSVGSITTQVVVDATGQPPTGNEPRGTSFHDTASVAGPPGLTPPTGTVTYRFFRNGTCAGFSTPSTVNISGGLVPGSPSTGALTSVNDSFDATYNGDTNYASATSACEPFVVGNATVATQVIVDTTGQPPTGNEPRGTSFHDTATVVGSATLTPTRNVTYRLFRNDTCTGFSMANTVNISGGLVPDSGSTGPLTTSGNYSFSATYNGDMNYASATSACEPFVVGRATVATQVIVDTTGQPPTGAEVPGTRFHDTAAVTGASGFTPTGSVTYRFFTNGTCAGFPPSTGIVTISGVVVPRSGSTGTLPSGNYSYRAVYSGDTHYASATSACEPFAVGTATVATQVIVDATGQPPTGAEVPGTSFHDTATVTGASISIPTGTVTYRLFTNGTCTGFSLGPMLNLTGGVVPDSAHTGPLNAGNYSFRAVYSGDTHYASTASACEPFAVGTATVATQVIVDATGQPPTGAEVPGAVSFHDTAAVSGARGIPHGTVTYLFFTNGACNSTPSSSQTVMISAGVVPSSVSTGLLGAGSYSFQVIYSGDTHYAPTTSACEPFVV